MKELPLLLNNDSVECLAEHTRLTNEKARINEEINRIDGQVNANKFGQLNLPVDYPAELNKIAIQINNNMAEQQQLALQNNVANQQIASLQQRSQTLSIVIIVAVIVIVIIIAAL